jgi:hypothetical protein
LTGIVKYFFILLEITIVERINSEGIVKEFLDPLSKKHVKREKKLKVYEKFSQTEKELFLEAKHIHKRRKSFEEKIKMKQEELINQEKYPKTFIPNNSIILQNYEKYYDKSLPDCFELDNDEIRRIFNSYDPSNLGMIKKNDIKHLFFEIKNSLIRSKIQVNEKKFINNMLIFYSNSADTCKISEIKKCFSKIIYNIHTNFIDNSKILPAITYLKNISQTDSVGNINSKQEEYVKNSNACSPSRKDIFAIRNISKHKVVLNENKLESIYK